MAPLHVEFIVTVASPNTEVTCRRTDRADIHEHGPTYRRPVATEHSFDETARGFAGVGSTGGPTATSSRRPPVRPSTETGSSATPCPKAPW